MRPSPATLRASVHPSRARLGLLLLFASWCVLHWPPTQCAANPCLRPDQEQALWPGISGGVQQGGEVGQTFRVSRFGRIVRIDFLGNRLEGSDNDSLVVELREGIFGNRFARTTVTCASLPYERRWIRVDIPITTTEVTPGREYALVMTATGRGFIGQLGGNENPYPAGALYGRLAGGTWQRQTFFDPDLAFRVYVCDTVTPVVPRTWGVVKAMYR